MLLKKKKFSLCHPFLLFIHLLKNIIFLAISLLILSTIDLNELKDLLTQAPHYTFKRVYLTRFAYLGSLWHSEFGLLVLKCINHLGAIRLGQQDIEVGVALLCHVKKFNLLFASI